MKLSLNAYHFEEIHKKGYNMDIVTLLAFIDQNECDVQCFCEDNPKINVFQQLLLRKGLITSDFKLTLEGKALLAFLSTEGETKIVKKRPPDDEFENWWKIYPGTDTFKHKNKSFSGTRGLRVKKDECKIKFNKILSEGEYTSTDLIAALEMEVLQKKENSVKTGTNKMSFMQNSLTYLNQRTFEPFIELIKEGGKVEEAPKSIGSTDI